MKIMFSTENPVLTLNNGFCSKERNTLGNEMIIVNICGDHMPKEFSEKLSVPGKIINKL
jgi:hypothetical protein